MKLRRFATVACLMLLTCGGFGAATPPQVPRLDTQHDHDPSVPGSPPKLPALLMEGMGATHFPITTSSPEAQKFFDQGLAQFYAFWFRESERSFLQAAALDPSAAMTYWGVAASAAGDALPAFQLPRRSNQSPVAGSPEARARDASRKAMELRAKASGRERFYIDAQAARRNPSAKDPENDYIKRMRALVAAYPGDLHAKAMLALALEAGYQPLTKEPRPGTVESLALLREVLAKDPAHVGAHHYLIHACEGGKEPESALDSAMRLPQLVPNIPHALHMPGHIYVQTGRWDGAIQAFESAALSETAFKSRDAEYPVAHYVHNQVFLIHVLGIQGRYREAIERSKDLLRISESPAELASANGSSAYREGWYALMKTLVRFEKWTEILDVTTLPAYHRPREKAWYHFARGLALASTGGVAAADAEFASMRNSLRELSKSTGSVPAQFGVAMAELDGYIALKSGNVAGGLEQMKRSVQMEDGLLYNEPSSYLRPVRELLGRALLSVQEFSAAEKTYHELLRQEPASGRALRGLAQALQGKGNRVEADRVWREFESVWAGADSDVKAPGR